MSPEHDRVTGHSNVLAGIGVIVFAAGPVIFSLQCLSWFKGGVWHAFSVQTAWDVMDAPGPQVSWIGLQRIIDWVLQLPLSLALMCVGGFIVWLGEKARL